MKLTIHATLRMKERGVTQADIDVALANVIAVKSGKNVLKKYGQVGLKVLCVITSIGGARVVTAYWKDRAPK